MDFIIYKPVSLIFALAFKAGNKANFFKPIYSVGWLLNLSFFYFLLYLICSFPAYADKKLVLIITDNQIERNKHISLNLKQSFMNSENFFVEIHHYQNITSKKIIEKTPALIIALGIRASTFVKSSPYPTLYSLIPENSLKQLGLCTEKKCGSATDISYRKIAVFLDQPLSRQLKFVSLLLPDSNKIGIITAGFSLPKLKQLRIEAAKLNLTIQTRHIEKVSELSKKVNQLINVIDVLFTLPDPLIHNRSNIPYLLLSTYRHNIPVIGFSKAYVNAGAIAAIYSSSDQIIQQITELARQILFSPESISSSSFPAKYFKIAINERVARSLELHLPETQLIKSKLLRLEK